MRFMPDSAILGTIGHARRRSAKSSRQSNYTMTDLIPTLAGAIALSWSVIGVVGSYFLLT